MAISTASKSDQRTYDFSRIRALILEPEKRLHLTYRSTFAGFGFRDIEFAHSPEEAFAWLSGARTHLIMAELSGRGFEFLKTLRASKEDKLMLIPVIATSALVNAKMVQAARDAGANEFVTKPFSIASLMKSVMRIIDEPKPFVVAAAYVGPDRRRKTLPIRAERRRGKTSNAAGAR